MIYILIYGSRNDMTLAAHAQLTKAILARKSRAYLAATEAQPKRKTATGTTEGSQRPFG